MKTATQTLRTHSMPVWSADLPLFFITHYFKIVTLPVPSYST